MSQRPAVLVTFLFAVLLASILLSSGCRDAVTFPAGVTAPKPPRQVRLQKAPVFVRNGFVVRTVARFELEARVLGAERYRFGRSADISPLDLALGWGPMSDQSVIDRVKVTQHGRFYWWRVRQYPIPRREIIENSSNMHMIPADEDVRGQLLAVRQGQLIRLSGYLANVSADDFVWRTSTSRKDAGAGACEIVWVESLSVLATP